MELGVQVVRTGRYKGAVEPFTDNQFSDENRAQIQNLLDSPLAALSPNYWQPLVQCVWQDLNKL